MPAELIDRLSRAVGHRWRDRDLGPVVTTQLFLQQVLHGDIAVGELRRLTKLDFTDAGYCQARGRLPHALSQRLRQSVTDDLGRTTEVRPAERWHGHRVQLLDGSGFSMPDTPAPQAQFGQPGGQREGRGFPVAHRMARVDAATGLLLSTAALPLRRHDLSGVPARHADLRAGDVLVGDRAFGSYAHRALGQRRGVHGLFRAHQRQVIDCRPHRRHATCQSRKQGESGLPTWRWLKRLGKHGQLVEYVKPTERPSWLSAEQYAALPETLVVREVRYTVREGNRRTRVVPRVTTLPDAERYPAKEPAKLYGLRWPVATHLRHLKQTLHVDVPRCHTAAGVLKERAMLVLIYDLVRRVIWEAARRQEVAAERISCIDAWRRLRHAQPGAELPDLVVNPERPGRAEPRVRKRRPKQFPLMKRPRAQLRKELFKQKVAA